MFLLCKVLFFVFKPHNTFENLKSIHGFFLKSTFRKNWNIQKMCLTSTSSSSSSRDHPTASGKTIPNQRPTSVWFFFNKLSVVDESSKCCTWGRGRERARERVLDPFSLSHSLSFLSKCKLREWLCVTLHLERSEWHAPIIFRLFIKAKSTHKVPGGPKLHFISFSSWGCSFDFFAVILFFWVFLRLWFEKRKLPFYFDGLSFNFKRFGA